jgi:hypothetical protein
VRALVYIGRRQRHTWHRHYFVRRGRRRLRATRGITINVATDCRSDASVPVQAILRRRIASARRERTLGPSTQCPQRHIQDAFLGQVCKAQIARTLCVGPLDLVPDAFSIRTDIDRLRRSMEIPYAIAGYFNQSLAAGSGGL